MGGRKEKDVQAEPMGGAVLQVSFKILPVMVGETAQRSRTLAVLPEEPASFPSTHMIVHNCLCNSSSRVSDTVTQTCLQAKHQPTYKTINKSLKTEVPPVSPEECLTQGCLVEGCPSRNVFPFFFLHSCSELLQHPLRDVTSDRHSPP